MNNESNDTNVLTLGNSPFQLSLRQEGFNAEKESFCFIKAVEKMVRQSPEYKLWVDYILNELGHNKCEFTNERYEECPIEIHHHPVCLFTIVQSVLNKMIAEKQEFSTFDVATRVIELHFQNKVGYVVMLSDLHSKYHSGYLQIPIELVNGDYMGFINSFMTIMEQEEYNRILSLCAVHSKDVAKVNWARDSYPGQKLTDIADIDIGEDSKLTEEEQRMLSLANAV